MKRIFYLAALLLTGNLLSAQSHDHNKCLTDQIYQEQIHNDPSVLDKAKKFEADYQELLQTFNQQSLKKGQKYIIPVVFHVFHKGGAENISKAQIQDQIDTLNKLFNNVDFSRIRPVFWGDAATTEIEFRLASKDPEGNCTDGIVRIYDIETENGSNNLKYKSAWPTDQYFNVWVVDAISSSAAQFGTTLGYAQFPWAGGAQTDGVVMRHDHIGSIGTAANPNVGSNGWGRTLVHEVGHWLGLYHTFQDSCFGGDQVDDTPPVEGPNFGGCGQTPNSCTNDVPDLPDQIENYMDYTDGRCLNMFTLGQKARMLTTLRNWRPKLISQANLEATGVADPYSPGQCSPIASFYAENTEICAGGSVQLKADAYNYTGGGLSYEWTFDGGSANNPNSANPIVTYANAGYYKVTLKVSQGANEDTKTVERYIHVFSNTPEYGAGLTENFEFSVFPVNGWETTSTGNVTWRRRAVGAGSIEGEYALMVPNSTVQDGANFELISPTIDLSTVNNPTFSFYYAFAQRRLSNGQNSFDAMQVYSSVNCGQSWSVRWQSAGTSLATNGTSAPFVNVNYTPSGESHWKKIDVALNAIPQAQRNNVRIKIVFRSRGGNNVWVDMINMGFSTSIQEHFSNEENFKVYPNPTANNATVELNLAESKEVTVAVYDLMGKKVADIHNGTLNQGKQTLNFNGTGLASGMYVIKMEVDGNSFTRKLMLQGN